MDLADVSKLKVITRVDEADIGRVLQISPRWSALPEMPGLRAAANRRSVEMLRERSPATVTLTVDAFPEDTNTLAASSAVEPQGKLNTGLGDHPDSTCMSR